MTPVVVECTSKGLHSFHITKEQLCERDYGRNTTRLVVPQYEKTKNKIANERRRERTNEIRSNLRLASARRHGAESARGLSILE